MHPAEILMEANACMRVWYGYGTFSTVAFLHKILRVLLWANSPALKGFACLQDLRASMMHRHPSANSLVVPT